MTSQHALRLYVAPLVEPRAYLRVLYVLARLPVAILYGLILAGGIAASTSLLPFFGAGLVVFLILLLVVRACAVFEREWGAWWFGFELRPMEPPRAPNRALPRRTVDFVRSPVTWKSLGFVAIQLPFGALVFAGLVAGFAVAASLIAAPFIYLYDTLTYGSGNLPYNVLVLAGGLAGPGQQTRILVLLAAAAAAGIAIAIGLLHAARAVVVLEGVMVKNLLGVSEARMQVEAARSVAAMEHQRAERSEQSRREMIVNVSHELRTPIASISGHVESLLEGDLVNEADRQHYLEVVQRETERLSSLVEDLLAVARGDAGELRLELGPVDVAAVVEEVRGALAPVARRDRKVTLTTNVAEGLPAACADAGRLSQVLTNLVRNAITYTPEGGIVSIELARSGPEHVELAVADTGIGIEAADLDRVFERLYRADASRSRATGGFGLGLAISRDLVDAMGGTLEVTSEPGAGSRFTVRLKTT